MMITQWSRSNVDYGRKLFDSGLAGARSAEAAFLHGDPIAPFLGESARRSLRPAAIGACLFLLGSCIRHRHSRNRAIAATCLGGALGFGAGVIWQSRALTRCVTTSALRNMGRVRDERWLQRHPIDYA